MHKAVVTLLLIAAPALSQASDCPAAAPAVAGTALQPVVMAAISPELAAPGVYRLGAHGGVLSRDYGQAQSLDAVLQRIRVEACNSAAAVPAAGTVDPNDPAAYVRQTEFDNTPYRFNMTQEGRRMTADDFDAWLQANGYSAGRRVDPNAPAAPDLTDMLPATEVPAEN